MERSFEKGLVLLLIILSCWSNSFSQTGAIQWKDNDSTEEQKFPFAYMNGSTSVEREINTYLKNKYLDQPDSDRNDFYEYEVVYPKVNICGVALTYEHEFNTAPGLLSFMDHNYFDLRDGKIIQIQYLIEEKKYDAFLKIVNERKNKFVQDFKKGLSQEVEDLERLNEIVKHTLEESINASDIDGVNRPYAMAGNYELTLYSDYLVLSYYWEYAWGIGGQSLPDISLKFTYLELSPLFNDYAKALLLKQSH